MKTLKPMSNAPRDGTEILAYHEAGNFHPVKWNGRNVVGAPNTAHWGMRWHDEYHQQDAHFKGWIPMPVLNSDAHLTT